MSDLVKGFVVVLENPLHEEEAKAIAEAIKTFRGVLNVENVERTSADWMAEQRIRHMLTVKLYEVLK